MIIRRRRKISIPTASMSDIAFLLLIFLMLTSLTSSKKGAKITLPQVVKSDKINIKKRINIFIDKEGKLYLSDRKMEIDRLEEKIRNQTLFNKSSVIFLYADENTEFRFVENILKILKNNSLKNCVFVTRKK